MNLIEIKQSSVKKFCQGDVNIYKVKTLPKAKAKAFKSPVLVKGNGGNHHKLVGKFKVKQAVNGVFLLSVLSKTELTHEQHAKITLTKGFYIVDRAKEKGMFDDMIAPVVD